MDGVARFDAWAEANPIAFTEDQEYGRGFVAQITQAVGHVLYLLGRMKDSRMYPHPLINDELYEALIHFDSGIATIMYSHPPRVTKEALNNMLSLQQGLKYIKADHESYTETEFSRNLTRWCFVAANHLGKLDGELLGVESSLGSRL